MDSSRTCSSIFGSHARLRSREPSFGSEAEDLCQQPNSKDLFEGFIPADVRLQVRDAAAAASGVALIIQQKLDWGVYVEDTFEEQTAFLQSYKLHVHTLSPCCKSSAGPQRYWPVDPIGRC